MNQHDTPEKVASTDGLGPLVERLLNEADLCRNDGATDIAELLDEAVAEIGVLNSAIISWRKASEAWRDCRTCRNFTTSSGGCVSVLRCIDGSSYSRQGVMQFWEAAPVSPAPF